ncbi:hypothetical protein [Nostoc sp. CENA543]|nr:hypothetical protein [Nostoc sp. CENA543]
MPIDTKPENYLNSYKPVWQLIPQEGLIAINQNFVQILHTDYSTF